MTGIIGNIFSKNLKTKSKTERAPPQLPQIRTGGGSSITAGFGRVPGVQPVAPNRLTGTPIIGGGTAAPLARRFTQNLTSTPPVFPGGEARAGIDFSHCLGRRDSALCMASARQGIRTMPPFDSEADDAGPAGRGGGGGGVAPPGAQTTGQFDAPMVDVDIAPGARALREEVLQRSRELGGGIQGDIDALRSEIEAVRASDPLSEELDRMEDLLAELESNQNPFIQARVAPFREASQRGLAEAARGFSRRGVQGGLAASTLGSIRRADERAIGQQAALATQEALGARRQLVNDMAAGRLSSEQFKQGLLTTRFDQVLARQGALDTINQRLQSLSAQEFEQELRALNIGQQTIDQILSSQFPETITQRTPNLGQSVGQLLGGIGQVARGFGNG